MTEIVKESVELPKGLDEILAEIQKELDKLGGTYRISGKSPIIERAKQKFRALWEDNFDFLSSGAKIVPDFSKGDCYENPKHKKRMLLRFYKDFIQKEIPEFLKEIRSIGELERQFFYEERVFIGENEIDLGLKDHLRFEDWKKRMIIKMYHCYAKGEHVGCGE